MESNTTEARLIAPLSNSKVASEIYIGGERFPKEPSLPEVSNVDAITGYVSSEARWGAPSF